MVLIPDGQLKRKMENSLNSSLRKNFLLIITNTRLSFIQIALVAA